MNYSCNLQQMEVYRSFCMYGWENIFLLYASVASYNYCCCSYLLVVVIISSTTSIQSYIHSEIWKQFLDNKSFMFKLPKSQTIKGGEREEGWASQVSCLSLVKRVLKNEWIQSCMTWKWCDNKSLNYCHFINVNMLY